jgi:LacI family transcriptional regulator
MGSNKKGATVTLNTVAEFAEVSPATASRALNGSKGVSPQTIARVKEAALKVGYPLDRYERAKTRTRTIGVIVANISSPFYATLIEAVEEVASAHGFNLILCSSNYDVKREEKLLNVLRDSGVEGFIIAPIETSEPFLASLIQEGISIVQVDRYIEGSSYCDVVTADHFQGAHDATKYLLGLGYRQIGILAGPQNHITGQERLRGYLQAFKDANLEPLQDHIHIGNFSQAWAYSATTEMVRTAPLPEALLVSNLEMTIGAIKAFKELHISIPDDVGFVGFDEFDLASVMDPPITTIEQPTHTIGTTAADLLIHRIKQGMRKDKPVFIKFNTRLNIRNSVRTLVQNNTSATNQK